jgi:hypothetical protein
MITPAQTQSPQTALTAIPQAITLSEHFDLHYTATEVLTVMEMKLRIPELTTAELPKTYHVLNTHLPSIFQCQCFNDKKIPFSKEVLQTEIGHLYEHIVLEYLCDEYCKHALKPTTFSGVTSWDWIKNPKGTFTIELSVGKKQEQLLNKALIKAAQLLNEIISTSKVNVLAA